MKALRSLMKKVRKGEGGFTLIELLIVVVILGILAAVVALNVTGFMGSGNVEAAKTELHQAETAVTAAMAESGNASITGGTWDGSANASAFSNLNTDPATYVQGKFKATYTFLTTGSLDCNTAPTNVTWSGIKWDSGTCTWIKS